MYVVLQIGQCGNQLGKQFFSDILECALAKENSGILDDAKERFFSESKSDEQLLARAVLVDSEPKVISETCAYAKRHCKFQYRDGNCFIKREGAANNWAMGYYEHGPDARHKVLDLLRKEVEACDHLQGFLPFMSVAGGTGSGLGTYLTEMLKDEYPSVPVMNQMIWPFRRGEVTVQSYNSIFTLSHLQNTSDAVVVFENDQLYKICTDRIGLKDVSLTDLNNVASQQLVCLLLSARNSAGFSSFFGDILAHLVAHPQFKLINLRSVPQEPSSCHLYSTYTWKTLLRTLRRMLLFNSIVEEFVPFSESSLGRGTRDLPVSVANLLLLRGVESDSVNTEILHQPSLPYASWVPSDARLKTWTHPLSLFKQQRIATVANNGQVFMPRIDEAIAKSWNMFNSKAYVHHYLAYGMETEDFSSSFLILEQVLASYRALKSE